MNSIEEKARIISVQRNQIYNLAYESEQLRKERDELFHRLRRLEQRSSYNASSCPCSKIDCMANSNAVDNRSRTERQSKFDNRKSESKQSRLRNRSVGAERPRRTPPTSISDGCIAKKLESMISDQVPRPVDPGNASVKRQKSHKVERSPTYELSEDIREKQVDMLKKKYGGQARTQQAAEIIQYNFRQYTLAKNFQRLRSVKDDTRVRRILSDVPSEKDSVWSDVTLLPPNLDHVDQYVTSKPESPCNITGYTNSPVYQGVDRPSEQFEHIVESEQSMDGSFCSTRAIIGGSMDYFMPSGCSMDKGRLHLVRDANHNNCITVDRNQVVPTLPYYCPPVCATPKGRSVSPSAERNTLLACPSPQPSGCSPTEDTFLREQSVTDSRLHNVKVQFTSCSEQERKRQYRIGLNLFNKKPEKGIKYLMEQRFLENSSRAVAQFILGRKGISRQMVGEYLGNLQQVFNQDVLLCAVQDMDFSGCEIDQALRKLISFFRLPGEAQKIERIMERFAQRYCLCNPDHVKKFKSVDTLFLIAFAIIMLNTDLHNPSIKPQRKMSVEAFIKNLKGIDQGEDINREMLAGIYRRIQDEELETGADHTTQVRKVEETLVGKVPQLVQPHRRLVCYCRLYEVPDPHRRERPGVHQREVFLFNDTLVITKIFTKKRNSITYTFRESISLADVTVKPFENEYFPHGIRLISRIDSTPKIHFNARNQHDKEKFVEDLKEAVAETHEMEAMRIAEELQKHTVSESTRISNDLGFVDVELVRPALVPVAIKRLSVPEYSINAVVLDPIERRIAPITDTNTKKRLSTGSVDSGMISTSSDSMVSREESPMLPMKNQPLNAPLMTPIIL